MIYYASAFRNVIISLLLARAPLLLEEKLSEINEYKQPHFTLPLDMLMHFCDI